MDELENILANSIYKQVLPNHFLKPWHFFLYSVARVFIITLNSRPARGVPRAVRAAGNESSLYKMPLSKLLANVKMPILTKRKAHSSKFEIVWKFQFFKQPKKCQMVKGIVTVEFGDVYILHWAIWKYFSSLRWQILEKAYFINLNEMHHRKTPAQVLFRFVEAGFVRISSIRTKSSKTRLTLMLLSGLLVLWVFGFLSITCLFCPAWGDSVSTPVMYTSYTGWWQ